MNYRRGDVFVWQDGGQADDATARDAAPAEAEPAKLYEIDDGCESSLWGV